MDDFDDEDILNFCYLNEKNFNFPFKPYDIQLNFALNVYNVLQNSTFGIFESPTGTGKSLSIICGALTWLIDYETKRFEKLKDNNDVYQNHWVDDYLEKKEEEDHRKDLKEELVQNKLIENRILESLILKDWLSKNKGMQKLEKEIEPLLIQRKEMLNNEKDDIPDIPIKTPKIKIIYCSRTHSQLTQFLNELKRSIFCTKFKLRIALLGSRKQYCVNEDVNIPELNKNILLINEKCQTIIKHNNNNNNKSVDLDLEFLTDDDEQSKMLNPNHNKRKKQTHTKSKNTSCIYYNKLHINVLSDVILSEPKDIEEIISDGRSITSCPYYASKLAVNDAQIVLLPYNLIICREALKANHIDLCGNVLIIDEAHNLLDSIVNAHTHEISGLNLLRLFYQITNYKEKYSVRISADTFSNLKDILNIIENMLNYLKTYVSSKNTANVNTTTTTSIDEKEIKTLKVSTFLYESRIDDFNIYKIITFIETYRLTQKLLGIKLKFDENLIPACDNSVVTTGNERSYLLAFYEKNVIKSKRFYHLTSKINHEGGNHQNSCLNKNDEGVVLIKNRKNKLPNLPQPPGWITYHSFGNPLISFQNFLSAIATYYEDCDDLKKHGMDGCEVNVPENAKIFIKSLNCIEDSSLKYVLLNPSARFRDILNSARSVILAGGTMKPFEDIKRHLFYPANIPDERIVTFECDHIIPKTNLKTFILSSKIGNPDSSSDIEFNFTFQKRNDITLIREFGKTLHDLSIRIPGGIVVFFPSYQYETYVFAALTKCTLTAIDGKSKGLLDTIASHKRIFREDRSAQISSTKTPDDLKSKKEGLPSSLLTSYKNEIKRSGGAILFSVVNGSLSEGINFNDDLARCVLVVGLPYPNTDDPEMMEKLKYFDNFYSTTPLTSRTVSTKPLANRRKLKLRDGTFVDQDYYQNLCMRAVNQSIGRAIRHKDDYAIIVLCDKRYRDPNIQCRLPNWIRRSVWKSSSNNPKLNDEYQEMLMTMTKFFETKKHPD